jgi:hypothetical protein
MMFMRAIGSSFAVVVVLTACGSKKSEPDQSRPISTGHHAAIERAPAPASPPMKLAAGPAPALGCFAWSEVGRGAACVTGSIGTGGVDLTVEFVSLAGAGGYQIAIGTLLDEAKVAEINATLAKFSYAPLEPTITRLVEGTPFVYQGATVEFTRTQTDPGGTNAPPSHKLAVLGRCPDDSRGAMMILDTVEGDDPQVVVRGIGTSILAIMSVHVAREGEQSDQTSVGVFGVKDCVSASSR